MKLKTILNKLNKGELFAVEKTELIPYIDARQSFYGKAYEYNIIVGNYKYRVLKSYNTFIAIGKVDISEKIFYFDEYSATSLRHIKEFLCERMPIKELRKMRSE